MLHGLVMILICQLAGEAVARTLVLPVPGPVLGMVLLLLIVSLSQRAAEQVRPVAQGLLGHLSLLFVPAGVGVVGHAAVLADQTLGILAAVVGSTALAIITGVLTFSAVAKMTGNHDA